MIKYCKFVIPDNPTPQARPRVTRWVTYDPRQDKKTWVKFQIQEQMKENCLRIIKDPVFVDFKFFMKIPLSFSKKQRLSIANGELKHVKKPDTDNLIILIMNCLTGIAYEDDRQIYKLIAEKVYDYSPRTEITLYWDDGQVDLDEVPKVSDEVDNKLTPIIAKIKTFNDKWIKRKEIARKGRKNVGW
jgi:Holliday junction resolvase RusA-like endonuclease